MPGRPQPKVTGHNRIWAFFVFVQTHAPSSFATKQAWTRALREARSLSGQSIHAGRQVYRKLLGGHPIVRSLINARNESGRRLTAAERKAVQDWARAMERWDSEQGRR